MSSESRNSIEDALSKLNEKDRSLVVAALAIANSSFRSWRERYAAADRALRYLGATRSPKGNKTRYSRYTMPCGCVYELYYASPLAEKHCSIHPAEKITKKDVKNIFSTLISYVLVLILITSIIATPVSLFSYFTDRDNSILLISVSYLLAGLISFCLMKAIEKKSK